MGEISSALDEVAATRDVRALLVCGAGEKAFCAGADIKEFTTLETPAVTYGKVVAAHRVLEQIGRAHV